MVLRAIGLLFNRVLPYRSTVQDRDARHDMVGRTLPLGRMASVAGTSARVQHDGMVSATILVLDV